MAIAFAELNGSRVTSGTIALPYNGLWVADVQLDVPVVASGLVTLTLGGLSLKGSVFRMNSFTGTTFARLVGGANGWGKAVPAKEYRSQFGVKFSTIAGDAARAVGETVSVVADFTVGEFYERQNARAGRVLDTFAPVWWMRADGVTVVGDRANTNVTSPFDVLAAGTDLGLGKVTIATDRPEDWQPGVTYSSPTISASRASVVLHKLDRDKLRTEIWNV